jgi:RNA-directed DNA polymerase
MARHSIHGLAMTLGVERRVLLDLVLDVDRPYHPFTRVTRRGKARRIDNPDDALKRVQTRIYRRLLLPVRLSEAAHGSVVGRSPLTNASVHAGARCVVTIDIKDFFPNVDHDAIHRLWKHLGYGPKCANFSLV